MSQRSSGSDHWSVAPGMRSSKPVALGSPASTLSSISAWRRLSAVQPSVVLHAGSTMSVSCTDAADLPRSCTSTSSRSLGGPSSCNSIASRRADCGFHAPFDHIFFLAAVLPISVNLITHARSSVPRFSFINCVISSVSSLESSRGLACRERTVLRSCSIGVSESASDAHMVGARRERRFISMWVHGRRSTRPSTLMRPAKKRTATLLLAMIALICRDDTQYEF